MNPWIKAARLRTLPLSTGAIMLAGVFSYQSGFFSFTIVFLAWLTAVLLQVLSNFANDYGDYKKGTDLHRTDRMVSAGAITEKAMFNALILTSFITFVIGTTLVYVSFGGLTKAFWGMMAIGLACIAAAIAYTVGKKPYGYSGFGDLFVFIFFGPVAVCGTMFLCRQSVELLDLLPGSVFGIWSVLVLNINNLRDLEKDKNNHKNTLVVLMGYKNGLIYHLMLLAASWIMLGYSMILFGFTSVFFIAFIGLVGMLFVFNTLTKPNLKHEQFNKLLKFQSLVSLISVLLMLVILFI